MPILEQLPSTIRVPFVYVEIDPNRTEQGPRIQPYQVVAIGQKIAAGTQAALTLARVTTASKARQLFGRGSQLAQMLERLLKVSQSIPVYAVAFDDPTGGGAAAAAGTVTLAGTATDAGEVALYIGGRRVAAAVKLGDTAATVATALNAAVNAAGDLIVTGGVVGAVVTLTCRHAGTLGNDVDVRHSYFQEEKLPPGITATIVQPTGGAGVIDVASLWDVLGDEWFNLMALPFYDSSNLAKVESELLDRFGPKRQIECQAFTFHPGDHATLLTFGAGRNSKHLTAFGLELVPTSPWEITGQAVGAIAREAQADPARPLQTVALPDVLAPARGDRWTLDERDALLHAGVATLGADTTGAVRIERPITTYQKDSQGVEDPAFLDVTTLFTLSFLRWDFRTTMLTKYARFKIGNDGVRYGAGQPILTPLAAKGEALAKFREWEERGLVEDADQFAAALIVERNPTDPSRLDFYLPANVMNGLVVIGARLSFLL